MASRRIDRSRQLPPSVFVHEILDPTNRSLDWLVDRGVRVDRGVETWSGIRLSEDDIIDRGRGHVALMGASTHRITGRVIRALPDLAFISKYGIGVDAIDMAAASEQGVLVTNTPVVENIEAVAEYTIAVMLALRKQLLFYSTARMRVGGWRTPDAWGEFLWRRTIGFVGFGRIGRAVARRLQGWDMRVLVYDPFVRVEDPRIEQVSLDELLGQSDIVTIHAVATPESANLIDARAVALMKPSAIIVNSARGSLMDTDAVYQALKVGRLGGLAMDAYANEPPDTSHPIFTLPVVIATPHASAWVKETFERIAQVGAENLWSAFSGRAPDHAVNGEVLA